MPLSFAFNAKAWKRAIPSGSACPSTSRMMEVEFAGSGRTEEQFWFGRDATICIRSAGLLPEDRFDAQPYVFDEGRFVLASDVRLSNRSDLAVLLHLQDPSRLADSEFLLHAWLRWDESCLEHLCGAFALVVWDDTRQTLFAARDHTGGRPLFFHHSPTCFTLATSESEVLQLAGLPGTLNRTRAIESLLARSGRRDTTLFHEVQRLPPGHWLRFSAAAGVECRRYWQPSDAKAVYYRREDDYAEALREVFDRSVQSCLRSNTPVASELSSGLDSSSVTATAAMLLGKEGGALNAFTAVPRPGCQFFPKAGFLMAEGRQAAELARAFPNITHHQIDSTGYDPIEVWRRWGAAQGEPAFNPVNYLWVSAILTQARALGCRVLLSGAMGNCAFSFHTLFGFSTLFRQGRWPDLLKAAYALRARSATSGRRTLWYALHGLLPAALLRRMRGEQWKMVSAPDLDYTLIRPELPAQAGYVERLLMDDRPEFPSLAAQREFFWLGSDDASSRMAALALYDVEERDPTNDRRLWEFVSGVPAEQFIVGGETRSLVRRAMRGRLPEPTRMRYDHGLQGADWYMVLGDARPALLRELERVAESGLVRELIDLDRAYWLLTHWPESDYMSPKVHTSWHTALSRGMSMASFLRDHDPALR